MQSTVTNFKVHFVDNRFRIGGIVFVLSSQAPSLFYHLDAYVIKSTINLTANCMLWKTSALKISCWSPAVYAHLHMQCSVDFIRSPMEEGMVLKQL